MSGHSIELAILILVGFWLGRNLTLSDYGVEVRFDISKQLEELKLFFYLKDPVLPFISFLSGVAFQCIFNHFFGPSLSYIVFRAAIKAGELSVHVAKDRYIGSESNSSELPPPEICKPASLFDYDQTKRENREIQ